MNAADLECNKELEITDTFEEELIQLMEMKHCLSEGNTTPFYQHINKWLLEMTNNEIILGLLDVDYEMKNKDKLYNLSSRKIPAVSHLISNVMSTSSANVSNKQYT